MKSVKLTFSEVDNFALCEKKTFSMYIFHTSINKHE